MFMTLNVTSLFPNLLDRPTSLNNGNFHSAFFSIRQLIQLLTTTPIEKAAQ